MYRWMAEKKIKNKEEDKIGIHKNASKARREDGRV
jgi:hypothetical protein